MHPAVSISIFFDPDTSIYADQLSCYEPFFAVKIMQPVSSPIRHSATFVSAPSGRVLSTATSMLRIFAMMLCPLVPGFISWILVTFFFLEFRK